MSNTIPPLSDIDIKDRLQKFLRMRVNFSRLCEIRRTLETITEEELIEIHNTITDCNGEAINEEEQKIQTDLQTFIKLVMFFRSETARTCLPLQTMNEMSGRINDAKRQQAAAEAAAVTADALQG